VALTSVAAPELAALIQDGSEFDDEVVALVRSYVGPLREAGVDTVILGCTHYPLLRPMLQRLLGPRVRIVVSGAALARQVEHALGVRDLANPREGEGEYRFLTTGDPEEFRSLGSRFLQLPLGPVEQVTVAREAAA
jgi:glutamate racemase